MHRQQYSRVTVSVQSLDPLLYPHPGCACWQQRGADRGVAPTARPDTRDAMRFSVTGLSSTAHRRAATSWRSLAMALLLAVVLLPTRRYGGTRLSRTYSAVPMSLRGGVRVQHGPFV